jgi:hypothetical protein
MRAGRSDVGILLSRNEGTIPISRRTMRILIIQVVRASFQAMWPRGNYSACVELRQ